jgi:hypothetical protein
VDLISSRLPPPPSNDEIDILGLTVRMPLKKDVVPDVTFENTNINNYSVLVRFK